MALIVDDQDQELMVWRYRFVTEQRGYELLGGLVDADTEEAGRLEWMPLSGVPEPAQRQELLGSGTLVALMYCLTSRGQANGRLDEHGSPDLGEYRLRTYLPTSSR